MSKKDSDILYFVAFCIESYKNKHSMSGDEVSALFDRSGIKEYLTKNFEVLHTQSMPWILEEIETLIGK